MNHVTISLAYHRGHNQYDEYIFSNQALILVKKDVYALHKQQPLRDFICLPGLDH